MKFIDVTLRDGGYQNSFNWLFEFFSNKLNHIKGSYKDNFYKISTKSKQYLHELLSDYSKIGRNENNGIDRVALTHADKQGRDYFIKLLKENNFDVKIDNIGNIFGLINFDNSNNYDKARHRRRIKTNIGMPLETRSLNNFI